MHRQVTASLPVYSCFLRKDTDKHKPVTGPLCEHVPPKLINKQKKSMKTVLLSKENFNFIE
jgi:hypothetical protein